MLTSALAVAYIEGVQSQGIAATIKHFIANDSEVERQTMSSDLDERTLREIYLPPFEAAVKKAGVWAIMSSYNRLNGVWTSENHWLLTELLREEWGYEGIVMSDWFGSHTTEASVIGGLISKCRVQPAIGARSWSLPSVRAGCPRTPSRPPLAAFSCCSSASVPSRIRPWRTRGDRPPRAPCAHSQARC